jgi:hypothetical protein
MKMSSRYPGLLAVIATIAAIQLHTAGLAMAADGCVAANRGALDAGVAAGSAVSRPIELNAGDLITFTTSGASIALTGGLGAPATLVGGQAAAQSSFKAPTGGVYVFRFAATADVAGKVRAVCLSTQTEAANAAFLQRRQAVLNERDPDRLRIDRAPTPIANPDKPLSSNVSVGDDGRAKGVEFSVSLSEITAAAQGNKKVDPGIMDFWLEGRMQNYESGGLDSGGNLGVLYLGTRSMLSPSSTVASRARATTPRRWRRAVGCSAHT